VRRPRGHCHGPDAGRADLATADSEAEAAAVLLDFHPDPGADACPAAGGFPEGGPASGCRAMRASWLTMFDHFETIYRAAKRRPEPEVEFAWAGSAATCGPSHEAGLPSPAIRPVPVRERPA